MESLQKRIDLKTEDTAIVTTTVQLPQTPDLSSEHPSFETAADTISDLLKVRRVRKSWLVATSHRGSCWNIHAIILNVDWSGGATVKSFSSYVKTMKSTASVGTEATFFRTK